MCREEKRRIRQTDVGVLINEQQFGRDTFLFDGRFFLWDGNEPTPGTLLAFWLLGWGAGEEGVSAKTLCVDD